jgi:eukaryotic-like serine/threonine-protein kinase
MCGAAVCDDNYGRMINGVYLIGERIGVGALSIVYRAERVSMRRKLAVKILHREASRDPNMVERFRREGAVLCQLKSAHTATTYEFGQDPEGPLFIAMELVDGIPLEQIIRASAPLGWPRALRIIGGLCDSLGEAHALGVVHRDLRPASILIEARATNADFVKVLDFGLAKLFAETTTMTPVRENVKAIEYASPEAIKSGQLDGRSDLYSLGVLAYLMITGKHPFYDARSYGELVGAHISRVPQPMAFHVGDVPRDVDALVATLLEKDPARRYTDAGALAGSINLLLSFAVNTNTDTLRAPDLGDEETSVAPIPPKPTR